MTIEDPSPGATPNVVDTGEVSLPRPKLPPTYLAVLFSCVVLVIIVLSRQLVHEYNVTLHNWREKLSDVADHDTTFVTIWLYTRQMDAESIAARSDVVSLLSGPGKTKAQGKAPAQLQSDLDQVARVSGYSAIYVIDSQGNAQASTADAAVLPEGMVAALKPDSNFTVKVLPAAVMAHMGPRIALAIPVRSSGQTVGFVLLFTRADHIYRLPSQEVPTTRSGASFVVMDAAEGRVVIFANSRNGTSLAADPSLDPGILADRTIRERHAVSGEDYNYRHVRTLVETRFVPGADWGVIAQVDREEALAGFYPLLMRRTAVGLVIVLALIAISIAIWRHQQVAQLEAEIVRRNRVEQDLRQAEQLFSKAFHGSPEPVAITTLHEGRFIEVNDAYLKMTEYERNEVIGKTAEDLEVWVDAEDRSTLVANALGHGPVNEEKVSYRTKSGNILDLRVSAEIIQLRGQSCLLVLLRDVTEQVLIEEQARQAQKMEALGRLAGGIAHDFNNLLGIIMGYSEFLAREMPADAPSRPRVEAIRTAAGRAASLASQLLAFSRKQVLLPKVVDLNSLVSETHEMLHRLIGENIQIAAVLDPQLGLVRADPSQIVQVIINLSINARDAMPSGGRLVIETANVAWPAGTPYRGGSVPPGPYVQMVVRDTGAGMTPYTQARIFDPFFTTKPLGKGTGLGLAIVSGIVEQSGGYLLVDSELGKGTTFKILFPRVDDAAESMPRQEESSEAPMLGTILLVEDEVGMRELLKEYLETRGYTVLTAANGLEALQASKHYQGSIDLLITDVIMPQMNGPSLARSVQEQRPEVKVLYMSGYTGDRLREAEVSDSEIAFIQKPFLLEDLSDKIRIVLGRNVTIRPVPSRANS